MKYDEESIMTQVINGILNPDISQEERDILLDFKQMIDRKESYEVSLPLLAGNLRRQAVAFLSTKRSLHPDIASLYKEISIPVEREKAIAAGIISIGLWL